METMVDWTGASTVRSGLSLSKTGKGWDSKKVHVKMVKFHINAKANALKKKKKKQMPLYSVPQYVNGLGSCYYRKWNNEV